jgi:hypothetical protein
LQITLWTEPVGRNNKQQRERDGEADAGAPRRGVRAGLLQGRPRRARPHLPLRLHRRRSRHDRRYVRLYVSATVIARTHASSSWYISFLFHAWIQIHWQLE